MFASDKGSIEAPNEDMFRIVFDLRICKDDLTGHHTSYRGSASMHCMDQVLLSIARTTSATEAVRKLSPVFDVAAG